VKICPVCSNEYADDVRFCPNDGQTLRASSPAHDLVGQVVADRYHVLKKLGEGGMGQVYLAEHVKMGRKSAIKVMNPAMVHDPDAVARFNREAANASRITHANVCAIYDFGETPEGLIYLAMEFIEGEPLTDLLAREGALPVHRAASIFVQVADALQAAHDLGIVHRDLKPDNIMLTRSRDGTDVVKVVDFGIAKAVGGDDTQKVTKTGLVVGTPEFMSPEQLSGDKLDGRSDIYSLALVLFKMLTGKLPFEATSVQETMIKRLTDDPLRLAAARPDRHFPPGLQETLDAAFIRSPADRYQSAAKLANDVAGVVGLPRGAAPAAPLPATRGDAAQRTQLLEAAQPGPVTAKQRSVVRLAVGAAVVLAAGGASAVLLGGKKTDGTVRPDTAKQLAPVQPARHDSVGTSRPGPTVPRVAVTRARSLLDDLFLEKLAPATAVMVRDSAQDIYNAAGIGRTDQAYAAFVVGNAFFSLQDRSRGCEWVARARSLDPGSTTYRTLAESQCQS